MLDKSAPPSLRLKAVTQPLTVHTLRRWTVLSYKSIPITFCFIMDVEDKFYQIVDQSFSVLQMHHLEKFPLLNNLLLVQQSSG